MSPDMSLVRGLVVRDSESVARDVRDFVPHDEHLSQTSLEGIELALNVWQVAWW